MMEIPPIVKRKPGRPPKIVVPHQEAVKSELNISHIIGHNIPDATGGVGDPSDSTLQSNNNTSPIPTAENKKPYINPDSEQDATIACNAPAVTFERVELVKSGNTSCSGKSAEVFVDDLRGRMEEYVKKNEKAEGLECICFHCRTFRNRFVEEMRRMLRG